MTHTGLTMQDVGNFLRRSDAFGALHTGALATVATMASTRQAQRGHGFYHQGSRATEFFLLTRGMVQLLRRGPGERPVIVRFVSSVNSFGCIALLGSRVHYQDSAMAVEDSQALVWTAPAMRRIMRRYPRITENLMRLLIARGDEDGEYITDLAAGSVEWRVMRALLRVARLRKDAADASSPIQLPLGLRELANYAGTTPYTVSRVLRRWKRSRIISGSRQLLIVEQFAQLACLPATLRSAP
jgi:CRP/FNR family transcriptional regulator, nitrogen oxide reductase regulator